MAQNIDARRTGLVTNSNDDVTAYKMGETLCDHFEALVSGATEKIDDELIPLMKQFYVDVAAIPIKT